jgi:hypothetical protein
LRHHRRPLTVAVVAGARHSPGQVQRAFAEAGETSFSDFLCDVR